MPAKNTTVQRKVVGVDQYNWLTPAEGNEKRPQRHSAERGQVIDISPAEAERGESIVDPTTGLPALGPVDAKVDTTPEFVALSEDTLTSLDEHDLLAYLGQVPEDLHDEVREQLVVLELDRLPEERRMAIVTLDPDYEPESDEEREALEAFRAAQQPPPGS